MVAEKEDGFIAEVLDQGFLLLAVDDEAVVVVICTDLGREWSDLGAATTSRLGKTTYAGPA